MEKGPVPTEFAIYGLGPVEMSVSYLADFKGLLESVFDFKTIDQVDNRYLLEVGEGGNGAQIVLVEDTTSPQAQQGRRSASCGFSLSPSRFVSSLARSL